MADDEKRDDEGVRIERVETAGTLSLDDADFEVENNTWIVGDDDEVIVIDPAHDAEAIAKAIGEREILAVICTNGYSDHVDAALEVAEEDEAPIALHPRDLRLWRMTHLETAPEIEMADGGAFEVGDVRLEVLHTPGASRGSVCLYSEDLGVVFTGDTLLAGRPGPVGEDHVDLARQITSIGEALLTLPMDTRVLPGHGDETTIRTESSNFDRWVAGDSTTGPAQV